MKKYRKDANELNLQLKLVPENNFVLPGNPLTDVALKSMIENSRKSGTLTMESAHEVIRKKLHS